MRMTGDADQLGRLLNEENAVDEPHGPFGPQQSEK